MLKRRHPYLFAHDRPYRTGGALLAASITSPSNNASFTPSTSISVTANASDADGTISQVQFFDTGNNLLGTVTQAPYSFAMSGLAIGSYGIYAIATDNSNATTTSSTILFSVVNAQTLPVFYIQTDQLNTPRLITNGNNTPVWRWDNLDPFADNIPNDDPANTGTHFIFNQRLPGQYADAETGLYYNWNRFYAPQDGRYYQSDLIGLQGGINTYAYVGGSPVMYVDFLGLAIQSPNTGTPNSRGPLPCSGNDCVSPPVDVNPGAKSDDDSSILDRLLGRKKPKKYSCAELTKDLGSCLACCASRSPGQYVQEQGTLCQQHCNEKAGISKNEEPSQSCSLSMEGGHE